MGAEPAYAVNQDAVKHAKQLIDARQNVLRSRWQDVQPSARDQNAFLKAHSWEEYRMASRADRGRGRGDEGALQAPWVPLISVRAVDVVSKRLRNYGNHLALGGFMISQARVS